MANYLGGYTHFINSRAHYYDIVVPPATPALAVSLPEVKRWLKIDSADCSRDEDLRMLIEMAQNAFESYTKLTLFTTTFKTTRDFFGQDWELRRGTIRSITRFEYRVGNVLTAVDPATYFLHKKSTRGFGFIALKDGQVWPSAHDIEKDAIEIEFTAGLANDYTEIPADIKLALLTTIACLDSNRGDCSDGECANIGSHGLSKTGIAIANKYRIIDIGGRL